MSSYHHKSASRPSTPGVPQSRYYSISTSERKFEYQNPQKTNIELKGNCVQHIQPQKSKEISNFRAIQIHAQPNTKRTLVPDLAPQPMPPRSKSSCRLKQNQESNDFNYISKVEVRPRNKQTNPKVYKSFDLSDSAKPEPYRREIKESAYTKYDRTSQISNLPGCIKRNHNEINDDNKPRIISDSLSHNTKIYRDYRSNITCLPGCQKNEYKENTHIKTSLNRYVENDIFNTKPSTALPTQNNTPIPTQCNYNSFNVSNRKMENHNRIYGDSMSNSNNNSYYQQPSATGIKRFNMKNRSQIAIL